MESVPYDYLFLECMVGVVVTVQVGAQEECEAFTLVTPEKIVVLHQVERFENRFDVGFFEVFFQEGFLDFLQKVLEPDRIFLQVVTGRVSRLKQRDVIPVGRNRQRFKFFSCEKYHWTTILFEIDIVGV